MKVSKFLSIGLAALSLSIGAASQAQADTFTPVDFSSFYNWNPNVQYGFPSGNQTFAGVPFQMTVDGQGQDAWNSYYDSPTHDSPNPDTITIPVNVYGVTTVFTLINTFWGYTGTAGATVSFNGSGGASYSYNLTAGTDVRDLVPNNYSTSVSGIAQQVYLAPNDWRMDMQTFNLPAAFADVTLTSITITTLNEPGYWSLGLQGVTVESQPVPAPAPGALALLGLGLIGLGGMRRKLNVAA